MGGRRRSSNWLPSELRLQLADEAARLIVEHGIEDFGLAKRKAAERFGMRGSGALPSNSDVQERIAERQRIFEPEAHDQRVAKLRRLAADVMQVLTEFRPRLVGPVLEGTATVNSAVELHVFSDSPELVAATLKTHGLRPHDSQRRYRFGRDSTELVPGFELMVGDEELEVTVFPERGSDHAPRSPVDGRPMRRARRSAVIALLTPPLT